MERQIGMFTCPVDPSNSVAAHFGNTDLMDLSTVVSIIVDMPTMPIARTSPPRRGFVKSTGRGDNFAIEVSGNATTGHYASNVSRVLQAPSVLSITIRQIP